jgi:hypothetical protein
LKDELKDTSVQVAGVYQGGMKTQMHAKGGDKREGTKRYENYIDPAILAKAIEENLSAPVLQDIYMFDGKKDSLLFV